MGWFSFVNFLRSTSAVWLLTLISQGKLLLSASLNFGLSPYVSLALFVGTLHLQLRVFFFQRHFAFAFPIWPSNLTHLEQLFMHYKPCVCVQYILHIYIICININKYKHKQTLCEGRVIDTNSQGISFFFPIDFIFLTVSICIFLASTTLF